MQKLLFVLLACFVLTGFAQADALVNINTASQQQLESINGIGPKRAQAIIEYREKHGEFKSVDELSKVEGFGKKLLEKIRPPRWEGPRVGVGETPCEIGFLSSFPRAGHGARSAL